MRVAEQARADGARGMDDQHAPPWASDFGILNAVALRTMNAAEESRNAWIRRLQRIKQMACGYRNRERLQHALLFHLGGLDLSETGLSPHDFLMRRKSVVRKVQHGI